ncbi:cardioacceleratory peptide receptor-like isoform X1 [Neodiprion pinetum]|uniref:Cardioacceleratory peptide receptor isoform X1 n=1 Tax=Neodiprion lecontei TaxID=441921 RepID=A0A6J0BYQ4_NEOLC|nr:cardioacceleratory peptide receptor isoform X1 [Neodiprion lecontei]XP_046482410.1 cardioacceleratory peptide receptor-like isoform X1 [Neodiprion pinetum]XP_046482419.1 cardioacceleratory peptide receptor-like isoform X1 [Neodiprion pinetum]XP_046482427.1 cardioacceleratory peptide receptor-like isoform X1 [Neodiprion pinetum]XP_046595429.1 cardioacceleratory peptide receptor isoform X1 [Neodiprion lecontei]XP_046595435.1 cardioacceleratory peptide receptor isoform X1 [Neodiprion lecontei]
MEEAEWLLENLNSSKRYGAFSLEANAGSAAMNVTLNVSSLNLTQQEDGINIYYFYEKEQFAVMGGLFFAIVIGNGAVLAALLLTRSRKSRMNHFIKQLAIADLLVGLINVGTDIVWRSTVDWLAGNLACKLIKYFQAVVTYSSTYVLVALSIDRYDAIAHPMNFTGGWFRAKCLIATAWVLSFVFATPVGILFKQAVVNNKVQCWIEMEANQWQIYISLVSVTLFILPAVIITACYTCIVCTIWNKSKQIIPKVQRPKINGHFDDEEVARRASSRGLIPRAKIKSVKMTLVIVFVFIICWCPYIIFDLLQVFDHIPRTQTSIAVATFIQSLAPLNSAANPIIYCVFSSHICRNLRYLLRKLPPVRWILGGPRGGRMGQSRTDTTSLTEGVQSTRIRSVHSVHAARASHSLRTSNHKL